MRGFNLKGGREVGVEANIEDIQSKSLSYISIGVLGHKDPISGICIIYIVIFLLVSSGSSSTAGVGQVAMFINFSSSS